MSLLTYLFFLLLSHAIALQSFWPQVQDAKPFSIMLDPAGDARSTGRIIDDGYERGVTLQCAETLKKQLEDRYGKQVRVVLTRFPGETLDPLQNANFANRLDVDIYVSIHFFQQSEQSSTLYMYYFLYNPITDIWSKVHRLSCVPYDQAHVMNINKTTLWTESFKNILKQDNYKKLFELKGPYGLPFKPLIGVRAPAIAFEIGLKNKLDWNRYTEPIMQCLSHLIQTSQAV